MLPYANCRMRMHRSANATVCSISPQSADGVVRRSPTLIWLYKRDQNLTYPQLAKLFDISESYARHLGNGDFPTVGPKLARIIEERTGGELRAKDLVNEHVAAIADGSWQ